MKTDHKRHHVDDKVEAEDAEDAEDAEECQLIQKSVAARKLMQYIVSCLTVYLIPNKLKCNIQPNPVVIISISPYLLPNIVSLYRVLERESEREREREAASDIIDFELNAHTLSSPSLFSILCHYLIQLVMLNQSINGVVIPDSVGIPTSIPIGLTFFDQS